MENKFNESVFNRFKKGLKIIFLWFPFFLFSQVDGQENDSIKKGVDLGKIKVPNPQSIVEAYTYDSVTDRYIYTNTFDGFNVNYPLVLTPQQYQELVLREEMRKYYRDKSAAIDGKKDGSEEKKKDLLPRYYVNSKFFEAIFGGNTIDVKPTGSVEIDLGVRFTKQDNPAFSPRNRKTTTFDFDQRISVGLQGKVGTRLNVNINYDTQSTFAFQNLIKLEYGSTEDDILQKLEVGNVSFPLSNSLIRGSQSLFGVKAQLQFGKTTVTGVFSEQKSQTKTVTSQGGGTLQDFELFALEYDSDRHYFLSQYFRNQYDKSLETYPYINSRIQITRIEVWVTNKQNRINSTENNLRNLIALQDLGEAPLTNLTPQEVVGVNLAGNPSFFNVGPDTPSNNPNNKFNPNQIGSNFLTQAIREVATANNGFTIGVDEGLDYAKLENARKLTASEFTYHPQLGYISLSQRLANDEVLAVAYQYTIGDQVYQVGEFGTDGVDATQVDNTGIPSSQALIVKLLKSNLTAVKQKTPNEDLTMPTWNLMMKNIYQIPGGYQLQQEDFKFNILYTDPSPLNYITPFVDNSGNIPLDLPAGVKETPLLKVLNVDKLNYTNDPQEGGDGFFDFYPGITVDPQYGRIIFTTKEPFGEHLFGKLNTGGTENYNDPLTYNVNQNKYVFRNLYKSTQAAALQESEKNKFQLRGRFKSSGGDGISIGAFNVPQGSVVVKSGGRVLVEGVDYTVNYQLGKVQLLDPSLQASNTPLEISVENNSVFGQQTRRFWGVNVEHQFNKNFLVGGTILNLSERPFTNKSNYGQESVNNTIVGLNTNFSTEVPFLTRLVNKLPNIDTDVPSNLSFRGEIAYLLPGSSKADQFNGEATTYVDDFEGSQSSIPLNSPGPWTLASVPLEENFDGNPDETEPVTDDPVIGYKRAKMAWYTIDPVFYTQPPSGINDNDLSLNRTRRIYSRELFPNVDIAQGNSNVISTLDLTYFPKDRGPYNFNPSLATTNQFPDTDIVDNWAGIMRSINSTNFEQSNVEYVQFWILDPYYGNAPDVVSPANTGKLVFNLGEISEDILKDGRKQYENGLPEVGATTPALQTGWGQVPSSQSLVYAFDTDEANRNQQDVGFDGLNDAAEAIKYSAFAGQSDPSADNYRFYLNATGGVVDRYRDYNGFEGNSPVNVTDTNRGNDTRPDVEDVNRDQTMNTINAYFKFEVPINNTPQVGQNYVVDVRTVSESLPNGSNVSARWVQYKIPILEFTQNNVVGAIADFRSIRFMRMYMTGFSEEITLRFGTLDLVRGEWRRYTNSLEFNDPDPTDDNTGFDVVAVNIQENSSRSPIPYVSPPGVTREQLYNNNTVINQNEQSLSLRVYDKDGGYNDGLEAGDSRAVFKNVNVDMRQFKKMRMFLHAESLPQPDEPQPLQNDQMVAFIRFGNDFTENFYQVEIPLKVSSQNASTPDDVWLSDNEIELPMELLTKLKILSLNNSSTIIYGPDGIGFVEEEAIGSSNSKLTLGIKGNPNFGLVRTLMVGVKNISNQNIRGEVWFNELRLSDLDNKGGYAAVANLDTNLADFATVSATTRVSTIGFGGIEEGPNERSREDVFQYDIVTNLNLGKLLPKKWGITLPFNYAVGEETITPKYDPFYQDIELNQLLDVTTDAEQRSNLENRAIDYTKRTSINFIGVRKERGEGQKQHFYDVENLTLSYSFNETEHHDYEIENLVDQQNRTTVDYAYSFKPLTIEPFKNSKKLDKSGYYKMLKDFNFNFLPSNISFSSNIIRQFNRQQFRLVDVEGIGLDPLYRRNYFFNYQYGFNYNLTKSLRLNYTAASNNIVRTYLDEENKPIDGLDIWDDYWDIGQSNQHNQQIVLNYDLPINKIPALAFVKSNYTYTGDFNWQRSSDAFSSIVADNGIRYNLGNTIQNANSHKLNTTFNMDLLYRYIGLTGNKKKKSKKEKDSKDALPKPGQKITAKSKTSKNDGNVFVNGLIGIITSIKNIQVNYTETNGTVLPGYTPGLGFFGSSRPSLGFVFGSQSDVRYEAARQGWLTEFPEFNQNFTQVTNKQLNFTAQVEPFADLKIDLTADRMYADNYSEQYDVLNGQYNSRSPYNFGNFSISTVLIQTAFSQSDENFSEAFEDFRANRLKVANKLASEYYGSNVYPTDLEGYPVGYGKNSQQVLLPSFVAAYSGKDISKQSTGVFKNVPLPNWTIKYTGLMRYKWFKDKFKRFSLQHGYRASYNVNSFRSNLNEAPVDANGNFYANTIISNVNLTEQFNPLMRVDFEMKNSIKILAEIKKDRTLNMSFDNNLLTEVSGNEYTIGLGYRIKNVTIVSKLADNPTGVIKSDINIKTDFSLRKNNTIVRYLDYNNNELAGGQDLWSIKLSADYSFSKNLTTIFFYDHQFSQAVISTSFPITNIRAGFTIRYNFGN
ncbi:cell surface protein SprA [Flavobacterium sp. 316]|uniref:T9SS outer membrane translocon Sov/SprA n=1 Tax=Flavobacterium sp. 316 TaxID=1603293 RepID=UPI0009E1B603